MSHVHTALISPHRILLDGQPLIVSEDPTVTEFATGIYGLDVTIWCERIILDGDDPVIEPPGLSETVKTALDTPPGTAYRALIHDPETRRYEPAVAILRHREEIGLEFAVKIDHLDDWKLCDAEDLIEAWPLTRANSPQNLIEDSPRWKVQKTGGVWNIIHPDGTAFYELNTWPAASYFAHMRAAEYQKLHIVKQAKASLTHQGGDL